MRPKLLDLFCCEGGAAAGYAERFDVYGVDLFKHKDEAGRTKGFSQKRYPFPSHQGDVLEVMERLLVGRTVEFVRPDGAVERLTLDDFAAIHASPPCQAYSITKNSHGVKHPELVEPTRKALTDTGLPYIIENVEGAPLEDATMLCWSMFREPGSVIDDDGTPLTMERHRLFETSFDLAVPAGEHRHARGVQVAGSYGGARRDKVEAREIRKGGYVPSRAVQQQLLGVDWMTEGGMYQCIPPMYAAWIARQIPLDGPAPTQ